MVSGSAVAALAIVDLAIVASATGDSAPGHSDLETEASGADEDFAVAAVSAADAVFAVSAANPKPTQKHSGGRTQCAAASPTLKISSSIPPSATTLQGNKAMSTVTIYSKGYCPFCHMAKGLLSLKGVPFVEVELDEEPDRMSEMLARAPGARTVPQIFIDNHHVGGFTDLKELDDAGKLDGMLDTSAVAV